MGRTDRVGASDGDEYLRRAGLRWEPKAALVEGGITSLRVVREEVHRLIEQIEREKDPNRVRALGDVLEKINVRYERLERELLDEPILAVDAG